MEHNIITAMATIDAWMYMLKEIFAELKTDDRSPIAKMIDEATGFWEKKKQEMREDLTNIFTDIIEAKDYLELDSTKEKEILESIWTTKNS